MEGRCILWFTLTAPKVVKSTTISKNQPSKLLTELESTLLDADKPNPDPGA